MKIIPQNGMILVKYLGRGETITEAGIIVTEKMEAPKPMEVVNCRVDAIDTEWREPPNSATVEGESINLIVGQVVMVQALSMRPIMDAPGYSERGFIRWADVIAVIEETEDAN